MFALDQMRDLVYASAADDEFRSLAAVDGHLIDVSDVVATADSKAAVYTHAAQSEHPRDRLQHIYREGTYYLVAIPEGINYALALYCAETETAPSTLVPL